MENITFDFQTEHILENDCVKLLPLTADNFTPLVHFTADEPEIWFYSPAPLTNAEDMKAYFKLTIDRREKQKDYAFLVYDKRTEQFAGSTRFYDIDLENCSLKIGYTWYGKNFQGTGLNKHCKLLLLTFAFDTLGFERVMFEANAQNERSIAAMKSIGCAVEGILRHFTRNSNGTWRDTIVLSILKEEWEKGGREKLAGKCFL
ncbi:MAG: GNAT family N-acetyltransferase [Bacteroidia bacterium]